MTRVDTQAEGAQLRRKRGQCPRADKEMIR